MRLHPSIMMTCLGFVLVTTASCSDENLTECEGDLTVDIPLSGPVPDKIQIIWSGDVALDECTNTYPGRVLVDKQEDRISINDGGFGYAPPSNYSVEIYDLKDCDAAPEELLVANNHPVPGAPFQECTNATVSYNRYALATNCTQCLAAGGTWQPEATACTPDCDIQDISCFPNDCPPPCDQDCSGCFNQSDCDTAGCNWQEQAEVAWCQSQ